MIYTFINYCAKVNIYFKTANIFGKKLHFFAKKIVLRHILVLKPPLKKLNSS
jgi:hypothetical protein